MKHKRLIISLLLSLPALMAAQEEREVMGEYVYAAPINVSREQARFTAIERAKVQALADEFGTLIEAYNAAMLKNNNDSSSVEYFTLGESIVKGEWIADTKEPWIEERLEDGLLTVKARVQGMARPIDPKPLDGRMKRLFDSIVQAQPHIKKPRREDVFVTLNAACSSASQWSFGFSVGYAKRFGWFVSVMSNGNFGGYSFSGDCDRDGYLDGGYLMQYMDEVSKMRLSVIAGGLMRLKGPLYARVGMGYGVRSVRWRTVDGEWFRNTGLSQHGLDLSAGLQLRMKRFVVSAETVTTQFQSVEAKIGAGIVF